MSRTIELSWSEMPRALPPPNFSEPFAAPSLRWACKKRLRCVHPDAAAVLRLSSSPPEPRTDAAPSAATTAAGRRSPALPPIALPPIRRPSPTPALEPRSARRRGAGVVAAVKEGAVGRGAAEESNGTKRWKVELWVSLSKDEIDRDFLLLTGSRPPRRPRCRPKPGSTHLLKGIFPGSRLPNVIAADRYKVSADPSDSRKR